MVRESLLQILSKSITRSRGSLTEVFISSFPIAVLMLMEDVGQKCKLAQDRYVGVKLSQTCRSQSAMMLVNMYDSYSMKMYVGIFTNIQ